MSRNVELIVVEGLLGSGKSSLLKSLGDIGFGDVEIWHEPVHLFQNYKAFKPLDLYYQNPQKEGSFFQLHVINSLKKYYMHKWSRVSPGTKFIICERSILSSILFINTMMKHNYISEFQRQYLHDFALNSMIYLAAHGMPVIPDKFYYIDVPPEVCLERIYARNRPAERDYKDMLPYLSTLSQQQANFMESLESQSRSVLRSTHYSDPKQVLLEFISFLIQP